MLKCCSLYSGSSGNSFFVQSKNTKILIDVGVTTSKINSALKNHLDLTLSDIDAIFITHEHIDHTRSLNQIINKYNIPIFASKGTWDALSEKGNQFLNDNKKIFKINTSFKFKDLRIYPFSTPHDATEPCGFNIYSGDSKISIATDIGHVDDILFNNLKSSSFVMLESNYEPNMLKFSSYPYILKKRIASDTGHLSNTVAGETIAKLIDFGLKDALLVHLSKENNVPEIAYETVMERLKSNNCPKENLNLQIAPRDNPSQIFNIK